MAAIFGLTPYRKTPKGRAALLAPTAASLKIQRHESAEGPFTTGTVTFGKREALRKAGNDPVIAQREHSLVTPIAAVLVGTVHRAGARTQHKAVQAFRSVPVPLNSCVIALLQNARFAD